VPACADNAHRPLLQHHDLTAILCPVEQRVVTNDFTIRCQGRTYQIGPESIRAGMKGSTVRVELRSNGELAVRFQEKYVTVRACEPAPRSKASAPKPVGPSRAARKPGEKSSWMEGFFDKPTPPTWKAIETSNATS